MSDNCRERFLKVMKFQPADHPIYSPLPECPVACHGDEWQGDLAIAFGDGGWLRRSSANTKDAPRPRLQRYA